MRHSLRMMAALGVALSAFSGCKKAGKVPTASEAECAQYRDKMFSFLPASEQEAATKLGMSKPTPLELKLCQERMTSDEIACALAATTQEAALACKPAVDIRPVHARRTPEECTAFEAHVKKLAADNESGGAIGPPFTPSMAAMLGRECSRWMTKERYDCVMKAPSAMGLMTCKP